MMKVSVPLTMDDLNRLKIANQMFGVGDEILPAKNLIEWAIQMTIAASEYDPEK